MFSRGKKRGKFTKKRLKRLLTYFCQFGEIFRKCFSAQQNSVIKGLVEKKLCFFMLLEQHRKNSQIIPVIRPIAY